MKRRLTDNNLFWNCAGMAKGIVISSVVFLIIINHQHNQMKRLLDDAVDREITIKATLTIAEQYRDALEANMEATDHNNEILRKAINNLGLGDHLEFQEEKLTLAMGGEDGKEAIEYSTK